MKTAYHSGFRSDYRSNVRTREWEPMVRRIISVDGEGDNITDTGEEIEPQAYTLLAFSDDRGYTGSLAHDGSRSPNPTTGHINYGLKTADCLEFLLGIKRHESDLVVGFSTNYDVTMMLRDIPLELRTTLASVGHIVWRHYRIEYTPKQSFRVSDIRSEYINADGQFRYKRDIRIWDTFAFFQSSFVTVLEKAAKDMLDPEKVAFIADMKTKRSDLAQQDDATVLRYCLAECEYLSIIMRDLLVQLDKIGFAINRYYGPGPVVMQFFGSIGLKDYMPDVDGSGYVGGMPELIPLRSYYGGRFEIAKVGFCGNGWNHDINSAYPAAMTMLPCLKHGSWRRVREYEPNKWGFYKVGSKTHGAFAPFPFRVGKQPKRGEERTNRNAPPELSEEISEGSILYAHGGIRWVGHFEVAVARKHFTKEQIPVYDGWIWEPTCKHKPFAKIHDLYNERLIAKANKDGIEKAYKLLINSGYGKTAQGIGWALNLTTDEIAYERDGYKPPKYQCYPWAAWITSFTRSAVTDCALNNPDDVISIATDGILTKRRLTELDISKRLGDWDEKEVFNIWLGMPGIYTYDADGEGSGEDFKRRGFSAKHFPPEYLREAWKAGKWRVVNKPEDSFEPIIERTVKHGELVETVKSMRAFVPLKQAVKRTDPDAIYGKWVPTSKELNFYPIKRLAYSSPESHDGTVVDTAPLFISDTAISLPYSPKQTWDDVATSAKEDSDIYYLEEDDEIR